MKLYNHRGNEEGRGEQLGPKGKAAALCLGKVTQICRTCW